MSKLVPSRQNVYHIWAPHKLAIWRTQRFSEKNFKPRRNVCHLWANLSRSNEMCTTYEHRMNLPLGGHRDSPEWKNHSQDRDEFRFPHKMRIKKSTVNRNDNTIVLLMFVSESIQITGDILHFCGLFGSAPYCYQILTNIFGTGQNFEKRVKSPQDASKMVDFIGRAPNGQILPIF